MEFHVKSEAELPLVAQKINQQFKSSVFLLEGQMGAGKTTLIKALCADLGCTDVVSSPTFSLVNHYVTKGGKDLFHFDFYRIDSIEEALDIGFEEYLERDACCFIEWSEKIQALLPENCTKIYIEAFKDGRKISIQPLSSDQ